MDKETLSNYGWIVICVLVLAVMIALATPFGTFVADAIKSTTQGLFDVNQNALNSTGLINIDGQEFDSCAHDYEVTTTTANCTTAGTTTHTCKLCGKSYSEEVPAGHKYDETGLKCTECGVTVVEYAFNASDYDAKMGTTIATDANVVIPETFEYNGTIYKVTSIARQGFDSKTNLTSITIPKTILSIGDYAFDNCTSLVSVNFAENSQLHTIGEYAFSTWSKSACIALESIVIPRSVATVGRRAFAHCDGLKSVKFEEGSQLTAIDKNMFQYCKGITSIGPVGSGCDIEIPPSVTVIEGISFGNCPNLSTVIVPDGVTFIGYRTFEYCYALETITIPKSVTSLGTAPFDTVDIINYTGTAEEWSAIENVSEAPSKAIINYNYTCE